MNIRLLVVDDEADLRWLLRLEFERLGGFEVFEAADGESALALIREEEIDVVLLDIRMPDMDGYQVMRRLPDNHPPVIALSAHAGSEGAVHAVQMGFIRYFTKPYRLNELVQAITDAVPATKLPGTDDRHRG